MPPAKRKAAKKARVPETLEPQRVEIDFVLLADFAQAVQGKLYLVGGGWNLHHARQYPSPLPFGLGIGVLVPWAETNREHTLQFIVKKSEGPEQFRGQCQFAVGRDVTTPAGMVQRVTLGISGQISLPEEGTYEIIASVPGDEKRVTFEALPLPKKG